MRHLRHLVKSLGVSGNRKEWRNDNGKYEKKRKDTETYYMNKPGTICVILSSPSLLVFLSRWMMQWALSCHGSTLSVWSSSDPSSFSTWFWVCWAGRFCLCLCFFKFYFVFSFIPFCQYAFFPLSVTDYFLSLVLMCWIPPNTSSDTEDIKIFFLSSHQEGQVYLIGRRFICLYLYLT